MAAERCTKSRRYGFRRSNPDPGFSSLDFTRNVKRRFWRETSEENVHAGSSRQEGESNNQSLQPCWAEKYLLSWMSYDRGRSYRVPVQESSKRSLRLQGAQTHPDSFRLENGKWPGEDASPLTTVVESAYWGSCSPVITNHLPWDTRSSRSRTSQRGD